MRLRFPLRQDERVLFGFAEAGRAEGINLLLSSQLSLLLPIVFASHRPIFSVRPCSCQVAFSKHSRRPEVRAFRPRSSQDVRVVWERRREDSGLAGCAPRFLPAALLVPQAQPRVSRWIVLRPSWNHHSAKTKAVRYVVPGEVTAYRLIKLLVQARRRRWTF